MNVFTLEAFKKDKLPLYEQLYRYLAGEIMAGRLKAGERLPSKKALASHLKISRNTVETAYAMLTEEGYLVSKPRSGFYVGRVDVPLTNPAAAEPQPSPAQKQRPAYRYDFKTNAVDLRSFPYSIWAKLSREVLYQGPELLSPGDGIGDKELREGLAKYLHEFRGVRCAPEQIVIGAGMEYLLMLLCELLGPGASFAVEDPGYRKTSVILKNSGRPVLPIALDMGGMPPEALRASGAQIAYITPSHQFPTGVVMPVGRRTELLKWAGEDPDRYLIEDDYNSEFHFSGRPIPAVQGLDPLQKVVYMSTFSRTLAPSIRIAYMVLPLPLLFRFKQRFSQYSSTVSRFEQQTLARFISGGYLGRHLNRVKNIYKKRREELKTYLEGRGFSVSGAGAGLHLLVDTGPGDRELLKARAEQLGIRLYFLSEYYAFSSPPNNTLVLGYGGADVPSIKEAFDLLFPH